MSAPELLGTYLVLSTWEEIITKEHLDEEKTAFLIGFIENVEQISDIDNKKGRIIYFDNHSESYVEDTFEREIVQQLKLKNLKKNIETLLIQLAGKTERKGFIDYLRTKIYYLIKEQKELFKQYSLIRYELKKLIQFLDIQYEIEISYPFNALDEKEEQQTQILTLKRHRTKPESKKIETALKELYFLLQRYQIIEENEGMENFISQEDFINTVKGKKTNTPITIIAKTSFAVHAIDTYKEIYEIYSAGLVEKSKIYKTKSGAFLSQSNYNTSLLRKPKGREAEIEDMRFKIKNLFI